MAIFKNPVDVGGVSGGGFLVPVSASIPFADIAARNAWATANLSDLIQSVTLVSVAGTPANTWFLWRGASAPGTHDPAQWEDATPVIRGASGVQGQAGLIQSVTAGDFAAVDNTDPANPIVSGRVGSFTNLLDAPNTLTADQFVQVNPAGNALVLSNLPDTPESFTDLNDTPQTITAEQFIRGNAAGDAVEFVELSPITSAERTKLTAIAEGAQVNVQSDWDETDTTADSYIDNKPTISAGTFAGLTDTPGAITASQFIRGNSAGDAVEFVEIPTGTASTFASLTDTPQTITADQFIRGNSGGTAVEFVELSPITSAERTKLTAIAEGAQVNVQSDWDETDTAADSYIDNKPTISAGTFAGLTDTPGAITAEQFIRGNSGGTAVEFVELSPITSAERTKLTAIAEGAQVNVQSDWDETDTAADGYIENKPAFGDYRFDGTIEITSDITINSANSDTYNLKVWLITGGSWVVNIDAGTSLTFFGIYVRRVGDTGTITVVTGANVRVNGAITPVVYDGRQSATFFSITLNRFFEIFNNFRPDDFLDLNDTPNAFGTAGQLAAVNAGANALVFIDPPAQVSGDARWDVQILPSAAIPNNHRRFYVYALVANVSRALPANPQVDLFNGWTVFVTNDSTTATLTITGTFRSGITAIRLLPQQGCEIVYFSGATAATQYYVEGAARETITMETLPPFRVVLTQNTTYTEPTTNLTWRSSTGGINLANRPAILDLVGKLAQVAGHTTPFIFDLPSLPNADVPIGSGFGFGNVGAAQIQLRTRSSDSIAGLGISYDFTRPLLIPVNSSVTIVAQGNDLWNITQIVGSIGGGF